MEYLPRWRWVCAAYDIKVDNSGNVYICGNSSLTWGTPINAFAGGDYDAFVAKLNNSGELLWNTFQGGVNSGVTEYETAYGIDLDVDDNVYVVGISHNSWGAPINAITEGSADAYVTKLNNSGVLQWNTFLGGGTVEAPQTDYGVDIVLDSSGNIFITGESSGTWGAPVNDYAGGSGDAFVAKLNNNGTLHWNTFIGGEYYETGYWITSGQSGDLYLTGTSDGTWGTPILNYPGGASSAVYAAKLNNTGMLQWHTFLGGAWINIPYEITLDASNNIFLCGRSSTTWNLPQENLTGGMDAFIAHLNNNGTLLWNDFLGGSEIDAGFGLVLGGNNDLYVTGTSQATWGTPVNNYAGTSAGFVAKIINNHNFTVNITGRGRGTINSSSPGISCPDDCYEIYDFGTDVTLTAVPANGSLFRGWTGDCAGKELECSITMDSAKGVTAEFYSFPWPVFLPTIFNSQRP